MRRDELPALGGGARVMHLDLAVELPQHVMQRLKDQWMVVDHQDLHDIPRDCIVGICTMVALANRACTWVGSMTADEARPRRHSLTGHFPLRARRSGGYHPLTRPAA
jgi:hypothetical protein